MGEIEIKEFSDLNHWEIYDNTAQILEWHGDKVLMLSGGQPILWIENMNSPSFRMECEVAIENLEGYIGCVFGATSAEDYETIYIYPGDPGKLGWIQYDPVMKGSSTWQIYHGSYYQNNFVNVTAQTWVKLIVDVHSNHVEVSVGDVIQPQMIISPLMLGSSGKVGLWGFLPAYVKSLAVKPIQPVIQPKISEKLHHIDGLIKTWEVTPATDVEQIIPKADAVWENVPIEENGTLNINRLYSRHIRHIFIRTMVFCDLGSETELQFGFSDELSLEVNGEQVYQGKWLWNPPLEDGRIRLDYAKVKIKFESGWNTITGLLSATESGFGWGIALAILRS